MDRKRVLVLIIVAFLVTFGCQEKEPNLDASASTSNTLTLEFLKEIEGFHVPECFVVDESTGLIYVSNVVTSQEGYWDDDHNGFISLLDNKGNIKELKWLAGTEKMPIHAPKGMTIFDGYLYFTDNSKLKRVLLTDINTIEVIDLPATKNLNDLATDGESVWVTETALSKIYNVDTDGNYREIPAPKSINGITCWNGLLFGVSWDLHEVYELDPAGTKAPIPFGVAEHFTNLDGIEVLDDGTFIVSDFNGNKVAAIDDDRKTVTVLAEIKSAADIGIDRERHVLYVPMFLTTKASVYKIMNTPK
jgi:DNA-binding beta-propeller fold protein YncE